MVNYFEAKPLIAEGDCIGILGNHGLFSKLTRFFTGKYTHTGIAIWLEDGLWVVELNGGKNHAIPMSQLIYQDFDVFNPPNTLHQSSIRTAALESIRVQQGYGYLATLIIGLLEFFGIDSVVKGKNLIVCSGYCVKIYQKAGWQFSNYVISPTKLVSMLHKKLEVRRTEIK